MAKQRITLNVAGESFEMTIDDAREDIHRFAAKKINSRVAELEGKYKGVDTTIKALAIAALEISIQLMDLEMSRSLGNDMDALEELDRKLGDYLNKL